MADTVLPPPTTHGDRGLEYLLLGDLRQLLDEPASRENRRWLLSVLDRLLAGRSSLGTAPYFPVIRLRVSDDFTSPPRTLSPELVAQLQRLRDRVAHGASFQMLAHEIRVGLQRAMETPATMSVNGH